MFKIQTLNSISRRGLDALPAERYQIAVDMAQPDAILVRSANMHTLELPASLKAVARAGAGTNNVPVEALSQRGIPVFNAPGANANAVKELVLAGMLLAARNLPEALAFVATLHDHADPEHAVEAEKKRFVGTELAGRTLGVVGLGAIGVRVANAARALGMRVFGFDPHMTVEGAWQLSSDVVKAGSLNELFAAADYLSFHVPLNDATRGLFGAAALNVCRRGVVLVNFAREGVIDPQALREGLRDGAVGRYVCDFPAIDLLGNPRVIAMPHLGASTAEAEENCAIMVVDQLREFLEHGNVHNAVNFPNTRMPREGVARLCMANQNRPGMIGRLSQLLGEAGLNIAQMHNASRGDLAYTLIDIDAPAAPAALASIGAVEGILSLRVV